MATPPAATLVVETEWPRRPVSVGMVAQLEVSFWACHPMHKVVALAPSSVCADGGASVLQTSSSLSCVCFQVTTPPIESTHRFLVEVPRALQQDLRLSQIPYSVLFLSESR